MEHVASSLGKDPTDIRLMNMYNQGDVSVFLICMSASISSNKKLFLRKKNENLYKVFHVAETVTEVKLDIFFLY